MPVYGERNSNGPTAFSPGIYDKKNGSHADDLFRHLGKSRDSGLLHSIVISIDAGVQSRKGHRQGNDGEVGGAARLQQKPGGNRFIKAADQKGQQKGEGQRSGQGTVKGVPPFF